MLVDHCKEMSIRFRVRLAGLVIMILICFGILCSIASVRVMEYIRYDINSKFISIEHTVYSEISKARHVIYGLASSLSQESIVPENIRVNNLVDNFDPRSHDRSIAFSGLIVFDIKGVAVADTVLPECKAKLKREGLNECLKIPKDFLELEVLPIRKAKFIPGLIIPLSMRIPNLKDKQSGTICSGLGLQELEEKLKLRYVRSKYINYIKIQDYNYRRKVERYQFEGDKSNLTISSILKDYFLGRNLIIQKDIEKYPFSMKIEIKTEYLEKFLGIGMLFCLGSVTIILGVFFFLYTVIQDNIKGCLMPVYKKLSIFNQSVYKRDMNDYTESEFNLNKFSEEINSLIDNFKSAQLSNKLLSIKQSESTFKQKLLNLVLTEQHFLFSNKRTSVGEEELYLNKLMSIIDEEAITLPLKEALEQIAEYCNEFYYESNIKVLIKKEDEKSLVFKQSALTETIFHILTFINRGNFNTDHGELLLKGSFIDDNIFPTIVIETQLSENNPTSLGWSSGPSYVYTSLLSVYLLAKENNLFFDIERSEDKISFTLDTLDKKIAFYNQVFTSNKLEENYLDKASKL